MCSSTELNLHPPSRLQQLLERLGVREVNPSDICSAEQLGLLYSTYPDLQGDKSAIGPGDDGYCQTWRKNPGWWLRLLE